MTITHNTILITGGTSGIGRELVAQFYALENQLIVTSSNLDNLKKLQLELNRIEIILCDLSQESSVQKSR